MWAFKEAVNRKYGLELKTYNDLYQWSIDDIAAFWAEVWNFTGITASRQYDKVGDSGFLYVPISFFFALSLILWMLLFEFSYRLRSILFMGSHSEILHTGGLRVWEH